MVWTASAGESGKQPQRTATFRRRHTKNTTAPPWRPHDKLNLPTRPFFCAVVASEKGVVVGRLQFEEDGDAIDCCRMGIGGKAIPPNVDK
eukprot:141135-Chlamydomonas_euryale.AAC.1